MRTLLALIGLLALSLGNAATTITYQGQLQDGSGPFTGTPGMGFRLFDSLNDGDQIGETAFFTAVPVEDGLFQVELDFGAGAFDGGARWLEIEVAGDILQPRQKITGSPWSHQALSVAAGSVGSGQIAAGAVGANQADSSQIQLRISDSCAVGSYVAAINEDGSIVCQSASTITGDLEVEGDIQANANVSGLSISYRNSISRTKSLPVSAFQPRNPDRWSSAFLQTYLYLSGTTTQSYLSAPVQLPNNAIIDTIRCYMYDNSSTGDMEMSMRLYRSNVTQGAGRVSELVAIATIRPSGESTELRQLSAMNIGRLVDNDTSAYQLSIRIKPDEISTDLSFNGCKVEYSVDSPAP